MIAGAGAAAAADRRPTQPMASRHLESGQVHREAFEIDERAVAQRAFVGCAQHHAGRLARLECFLPTRGTEAPTVAGFEAAKAE